jgi:hypothetical protein
MSRTPPGPRGLLTMLRLARRAGTDPLGCFLHLAQTYGNLIILRLGPVRFCILNHPDLVRDVLVHQAKSFRKAPRLKHDDIHRKLFAKRTSHALKGYSNALRSSHTYASCGYVLPPRVSGASPTVLPPRRS